MRITEFEELYQGLVASSGIKGVMLASVKNKALLKTTLAESSVDQYLSLIFKHVIPMYQAFSSMDDQVSPRLMA